MTETPTNARPAAALDTAHIGDIEGAFGTIRHHDEDPRSGLKAKLKTLLAIVGPGLIVMTGDNDAGAFSTYGQAGQNYGTSLLWVLLLLVPVLYVNQEMVLRLGVVSGVGHARLILERFGKFWGKRALTPPCAQRTNLISPPVATDAAAGIRCLDPWLSAAA